MLKIGITGNIGSGKTTISQVFELLGIPVFYADNEAKKVMTADAILIAALRETFGPEAYLADGTLNRKYIAGIVFNNEAELKKLNALVHPAVFRAFDNWVLQHAHAPYVLKEAAILFESGSHKDCNYTILVTAPDAMRIDRVMQRDHITQQEAESRNAKQMPQEQKAALANFIIANDNTQLVIPQILALHQQFLAEASTR
ncbi:dephospho-CoA kinase [Mucilaginibacter sp. Bleaf8]|uniref:dephospho-CoA kinase n=1 Tax=Mucilaginibacter sp. Bleaf8 TaxID=2834430 RepID=UPI001BCE3BE9|nr:dephospho-CoA kinase [Mucilaginibacter sp. Bleaf8]MBS7563616.1 dephospho-CoA kinase [Mucilaginibacter sp. Bleaf8]